MFKKDKLKFSEKTLVEIYEQVEKVKEARTRLLNSYKKSYNSGGVGMTEALESLPMSFLFTIVNDLKTDQIALNQRYFQSIVEEVEEEKSIDRTDFLVFSSINETKLEILRDLDVMLFKVDLNEPSKKDLALRISEYIACVTAEFEVGEIDEDNYYGWYDFVKTQRFNEFFLKMRIGELTENVEKNKALSLNKKHKYTGMELSKNTAQKELYREN